MKKWSLIFLFLSGLIFQACTHEQTPDEDNLDSSVGSACRDTSQIVCTREYVPTTCTFAQQEFSASNPCETKKMVRDYACARNLTFQEQDIQCDVSSVVAKDAGCGEARICTREYQPKVCRFGGLEAKGSNSCEALNALRSAACSKAVAFEDGKAVCEDAAASPSQPRSR